MSELYSVCAQWKNLMDIKSVHFFPKKRPSVKTSIVCFNYEKPDEFIGQKSMKKLYEELKNFEEEDLAEGIVIKGGFLKKTVDRNSDLIEALGCALKENIIKERLYAFIEEKVHPLHIKSFPTVRFSKKLNEDECNTCLSKFKTNEKLIKLRCGQVSHIKCLRKWLKRSNSCPFCREILS